MPDISGESGIVSIGEVTSSRAVPLSGWFSSGRTLPLSGNYGAGAVGSVVYGESEMVWAASPSNIDIQAAIDLAEDGDVVMVPAGSVTWTGNVTVPSTKGVQVIVDGTATVNLNSVGHVYLYTRSTNSRVRLSGFTFTNAPVGGLQVNNYDLGATNWRVDHCRWENCTTANVVRILGYTFGVFDNCTWWNCFRPLWIDMQYSTFDLAGYPGPINYPGAYSWTQPLDQGGPSAVYFEDCEVHNDTADIFFNCRAGARFVWRNNRMTGAAQQLQTHSGCTPGMRNPRWAEFYDNSWEETSGSNNPALWLRGMNGIIFDNASGTAHPSVTRLDYEFACLRFEPCNGGWPVPGYLQDPPVPETFFVYPAQDQPGVGLDTGWQTAQALDEAKVLCWGNRRVGVLQPLWFESCSLSASLIQENRDYYNETSPFTGAAGIGVGLLSARPSSGLTTGVYYWATDTRTLYKATGPTTWATFYSPYTYPHPLRAL